MNQVIWWASAHFRDGVTLKTFYTKPTKKRYSKEGKWYFVRKVVRNNYKSRTLIDFYRLLGISPKNSTLSTRLFFCREACRLGMELGIPYNDIQSAFKLLACVIKCLRSHGYTHIHAHIHYGCASQ